MRGRTVIFTLIATLAGVLPCTAQAQVAHAPIQADLYCSGIITSDAVSRDTYLITGEQSSTRISFVERDYVFINKGANQGVKVGDEFLVVRKVKDQNGLVWFRWQSALIRAMGTPWEDEGRLRVVVAQPNLSTAQVVQSCDLMQRGDIVLPFAERPAPPLKAEDHFDRFAPASGKAKAMVVTSKRFHAEDGANNIVYINLGSAQGVKTGDYFRIYRYQDNHVETAYREGGYTTRIFGYGTSPGGYKWDNLPREVLGEGIVLRTGPNSSTVLITFSLREIFVGDYVELE